MGFAPNNARCSSLLPTLFWLALYLHMYDQRFSCRGKYQAYGRQTGPFFLFYPREVCYMIMFGLFSLLFLATAIILGKYLRFRLPDNDYDRNQEE